MDKKIKSLYWGYEVPEIIAAKFLVALYKEVQNGSPSTIFDYKGHVEKRGDTVRLGHRNLCVSSLKIACIGKESDPYKADILKKEAKKVATELLGEIEKSVGDTKYFVAQTLNPKNTGEFLEIDVVYGIMGLDDVKKATNA